MLGTISRTKSREYINSIILENPELIEIVEQSNNFDDFIQSLKKWVFSIIEQSEKAKDIYSYSHLSNSLLHTLEWNEFAAIRLMDYIDNEGRTIEDLNFYNKVVKNSSIRYLFEALKNNKLLAGDHYYEDMLFLFRQLNGKLDRRLPDIQQVENWMGQHPSGLDKKVLEHRKANKERIIRILVEKIDSGEMKSSKYKFSPDLTIDEKCKLIHGWWDEYLFHLHFAVRTARLLDEVLGDALDSKRKAIMYEGEEKGIPIFVNPYYLSLMLTKDAGNLAGTDMPLRQYIYYSQELVDKFGRITAWEKEDIVEPGKPNAAGWILPTHSNIHRRYPEVAILIPDTIGRACAGLCSSCQRMYDFQSGNLNFNLDKLKPKESWPLKLQKLMEYYRYDSKLRDILITGGDALMSKDKSLKGILDAVYEMAVKKIEDNKSRPDGKKYAEMLRVRLGTRLPVYLPQRVTPELIAILKEFKEKAKKIGFKKFVIQTHFISAMEITDEAKRAVKMLNSSGWIVTNQHVLTSAASRRGHSSKLRKALNDIGVLTYYTFTVKGFKENYNNFATNSRSVQEMVEEKIVGKIPEEFNEIIKTFPEDAENNVENIARLRKEIGIPFLATDRNLINLPGKGKSMTFRTIGITDDGRRILEFAYDHTRLHSPIIPHDTKLNMVESKSIRSYLDQVASMGDDEKEYETIWGYSISHTEARQSVYEYPDYEFTETEDYTNIEIDG